MTTFEVCLVVLGVLAVVPFLWKAWVQMHIGQTYNLYITTDQGESVGCALSFPKDMSMDEKKRRMNEAFELGEFRREFVDARFKAHVAKELEKNQLSAVK